MASASTDDLPYVDSRFVNVLAAEQARKCCGLQPGVCVVVTIIGTAIVAMIITLLAVYVPADTSKDLNPASTIFDVSKQIWDHSQSNFITDVEYDPEQKPLFGAVDESKFKGTYKKLIDLFDNYNPEIGTNETCDSSCEKEKSDFLDALIDTNAMILARKFIGKHSKPEIVSKEDFKKYLHSIWFTLYSRSNGINMESCGFEHVFLGEVNSNKNLVLGYHNWVKAYKDEKGGSFVYGVLRKVCDPDIPKFSMYYQNKKKPVTAMLIKTPPEVELALYTICFAVEPNFSQCEVNLGGINQYIQTYAHNCVNDNDNKCIGTAYFNCL